MAFFRAFHEVAAATAVHVHFDAAGHYGAAFCVDTLGAFDGQVGVDDVDDLVAVNQDGASVQPTFGGQDAPVDDLCQHKRLMLEC